MKGSIRVAKKKLYDQHGNEVKNARVKKPFYKKWWFWLLILIMGGIGSMGGEEETVTPQETEQTEVVADTNDLEEETDTAEKPNSEEAEEEAKKKAEEEKRAQEEAAEKERKAAEEQAKKEAEKVDENITFLENGIALYTDNRNIVFSEKSHIENFSGTHVTTLKENVNHFDNGVIFRNVITLQDQYGNQEDTNVIVVYYSPETIEKINFDNWPTLDARGLYETADNVFIHYVLLSEANDFHQYTNTEGAPGEFLNYAGTRE